MTDPWRPRGVPHRCSRGRHGGDGMETPSRPSCWRRIFPGSTRSHLDFRVAPSADEDAWQSEATRAVKPLPHDCTTHRQPRARERPSVSAIAFVRVGGEHKLPLVTCDRCSDVLPSSVAPLGNISGVSDCYVARVQVGSKKMARLIRPERLPLASGVLKSRNPYSLLLCYVFLNHP